MPRFLNLNRLNPHQLLVSTLLRSRYAMTSAYSEAFNSSDRPNELMHRLQRSKVDRHAASVFRDFGAIKISGDDTPSDGYLDRLHADAQAEDIQCDQQSSLLILFADDLLHRYPSMLLGYAPSIDPAKPREFGPKFLGIPLTSLLRSGTNAIRHVSEWDERFQSLPYPDINDPAIRKGSNDFRALQSIRIIQAAFGLGRHELIRDVVSWRIVVTIDGRYGTPGVTPSYFRFENALLSGARDIA